MYINFQHLSFTANSRTPLVVCRWTLLYFNESCCYFLHTDVGLYKADLRKTGKSFALACLLHSSDFRQKHSGILRAFVVMRSVPCC